MDAILKRRSIRKFLDQPIPEEALEKILRAGMAAPSAGGSAEWEFVLFGDPKKKEALMEVSEYAFPVKPRRCVWWYAATWIGRSTKTEDGGCRIAARPMENMLLEATDLGIGSIWLGIYPYEERVAAVRSLFSLPEPGDAAGHHGTWLCSQRKTGQRPLSGRPGALGALWEPVQRPGE